MAAKGELIATASVGSDAANMAIGCLGAIATVPLVAFVMNLVLTDLPEAVEPLTPWFGVAAGLLLAATAIVFLRTRKRAELIRSGDDVALLVNGREIVRQPFELRYGYQRVKLKATLPAISVLILGIIKDGQPIVSLIEEWGAAHGTPGWPVGWPQLPQGPKHHYRVLAGKLCAPLVAAATRPSSVL